MEVEGYTLHDIRVLKEKLDDSPHASSTKKHEIELLVVTFFTEASGGNFDL